MMRSFGVLSSVNSVRLMKDYMENRSDELNCVFGKCFATFCAFHMRSQLQFLSDGLSTQYAHHIEIGICFHEKLGCAFSKLLGYGTFSDIASPPW